MTMTDSHSEIQRSTNNAALQKNNANQIATALSIDGPFLIHVDHSLSLLEMIQRGEYKNGWETKRNITEERFPNVHQGKALQYPKEVFLVPPSEYGIPTTQWHAELELDQWKNEQLWEILALGIQHPELQLKHRIIAFDTQYLLHDGFIASPGLWSVDRERHANALWYIPSTRWNLEDRALVSKLVST
ncbi:MAG: hypothetical protein WC477_00180 [Patescibacteria group bacterium]